MMSWHHPRCRAGERRSKAAARPLPLAPQHTGCGALVRWLSPSAGGLRGAGHLYDGFLRLLVARPARDVAAVAVGQMWLVEATPCVSPQLHTARSGRAGAAY